ncbi:hypothetical protein HPB52_000708 [Rhipicephalus sanguineus]|uniref:FF domain-containing protein n=1 Tax=Rhipicephalus sanguineus TaxID=34632 RepID=A0A9D4QF66_RHISA|nr:hypothetical protein HPB52_000708 [Rhipicephalus sanguineus]
MMKKDFLELLKEQKTLDKHSRWGDVKKSMAEDARYRAVESSSQREEWFKEYVSKLTTPVRNPDASWREAKRTLRKDHRWDLVESLEREEREKLFAEHLEQLQRKKKDKYRDLLDETPGITLSSTWKEELTPSGQYLWLPALLLEDEWN